MKPMNLDSYVADKYIVKRFCQNCRCAMSDVKKDGVMVCPGCSKPRISAYCGLTMEMIKKALEK